MIVGALELADEEIEQQASQFVDLGALEPLLRPGRTAQVENVGGTKRRGARQLVTPEQEALRQERAGGAHLLSFILEASDAAVAETRKE